MQEHSVETGKLSILVEVIVHVRVYKTTFLLQFVCL